MDQMDRRDFMKTSAAAAGAALMTGTPARAQNDGLDHRNERPDRMAYVKLGKTNFMCSRVVFGCGAALIGGRGVRLLERAYEAGVNFYDVGTEVYYKGAEKSLADFYKAHRGDIWVTSKSMVRADIRFRGNDPELTASDAKAYADYWTEQLDASLVALNADYVDAYYLMGIDNPVVIKAEEIGRAFERAKAAGKVGHFGISTHSNQEACLDACVETGWYSLAMIAITPAGWFDLKTRTPQLTEGGLKAIRPALDRARNAGIGLISMKTGLPLAARPYSGSTDFDDKSQQAAMFDRYYGETFLNSGLTPFQRSYAYVLGNGIDVMNADMQNFKHLEENIAAARKAGEYFA